MTPGNFFKRFTPAVDLGDLEELRRGTQAITSPKNIGDFNTYYNQGLVKFALGQTPLTDASWADFIKGLDSLGAKAWEGSAKKDLQAGEFLK